MAITFRCPDAGLAYHFDCGSQYTATAYQMLLNQHKINLSMSGKGNCYDNAAVESFFKNFESELIWRRTCKTSLQAESMICDYINYVNNARRRHSTFGNISSMTCEKLMA